MAKPNGNTPLAPITKTKYVQHLARLGLPLKAARATSVTPQRIAMERKRDTEFDAACELAMDDYREHLEETVYKRAVLGYEQPVFGRTGIIGHKQVYSDRLLELHLKRHISAYRDKSAVDLNVKGGVLAIPVPPDDWEKLYGGNKVDETAER